MIYHFLISRAKIHYLQVFCLLYFKCNIKYINNIDFIEPIESELKKEIISKLIRIVKNNEGEFEITMSISIDKNVLDYYIFSLIMHKLYMLLTVTIPLSGALSTYTYININQIGTCLVLDNLLFWLGGMF